jgi:hypothetical protein
MLMKGSDAKRVARAMKHVPGSPGRLNFRVKTCTSGGSKRCDGSGMSILPGDLNRQSVRSIARSPRHGYLIELEAIAVR